MRKDFVHNNTKAGLWRICVCAKRPCNPLPEKLIHLPDFDDQDRTTDESLWVISYCTHRDSSSRCHSHTSTHSLTRTHTHKLTYTWSVSLRGTCWSRLGPSSTSFVMLRGWSVGTGWMPSSSPQPQTNDDKLFIFKTYKVVFKSAVRLLG